MTSAIPTKSLELWLLGWGESHSGGCKVTFQVTQDDLEYFRDATVRKGKVAGQRYAAVLVQLTDDDKPDPESVKPDETVVGAKLPVSDVQLVEVVQKHASTSHFPPGLTGLSVSWCNDASFQKWLSVTHPVEHELALDVCNPNLKSFASDLAATTIKLLCGIESRSELARDHDAAAQFNAMVRAPYMAFLREGGVDE